MKITKQIVFLTIALLGLSGFAFAQSTNELEKWKDALRIAVDSTQLEEVIKLEDRFRSVPDDHPRVAYARYYAGLANYRLNTIFQTLSKDRRKKHLNEAAKMLEAAVETKPDFPDAQALLASVYGIKASGFFSGMKYGPMSQNAMEKALKQGPENPRVRMLNGVGLLNKPSMVGGSVTGAIEEFKRAAELFTVYDTENPLLPEWGHAENYAWLGQAYKENGEPEKAREAYEQALEINPDYGWVVKELMPELES